MDEYNNQPVADFTLQGALQAARMVTGLTLTSAAETDPG